MKNKKMIADFNRFSDYLKMTGGGVILLLVSSVATATEANGIHAIPDYGKSDCVSFKSNTDTNPLNFTFGYACVSDAFCEVSTHGCIDEKCHVFDYSKGTRTALSDVPMATRINQISMAEVGKDLRSNGSWCLVQDGVGNYWSLDKARGNSELFSLKNKNKSIIPCKTTDYFSSAAGCTPSVSP